MAGMYRRRIGTVEAVQYTGSEASQQEVIAFLGDAFTGRQSAAMAAWMNQDTGGGPVLWMDLRDGSAPHRSVGVKPGWWVVREADGKCRPWEPERFERTYLPEHPVPAVAQEHNMFATVQLFDTRYPETGENVQLAGKFLADARRHEAAGRGEEAKEAWAKASHYGYVASRALQLAWAGERIQISGQRVHEVVRALAEVHAAAWLFVDLPQDDVS